MIKINENCIDSKKKSFLKSIVTFICFLKELNNNYAHFHNIFSQTIQELEFNTKLKHLIDISQRKSQKDNNLIKFQNLIPNKSFINEKLSSSLMKIFTVNNYSHSILFLTKDTI